MFLPVFAASTPYSGLISFVGGIILLIIGYMTYGRFVEKILGPDDRKTPALKHTDGVDYLVLPGWKNMLIQLLNIAGVGPVIGVIAGIKFGAIVFLLIPIGNIIGGATHDFISGMASLRNKGGNLPGFIKLTLGDWPYRFFSVFVIFLLLLVVAVFINIPAHLIDGSLIPKMECFWWAVGGIFLYYIVATMFPVDKIIGRFYPIFGGILLLGTLALLCALIVSAVKDPTILLESEVFKTSKTVFCADHPIIPCLFVTIACGILSGFHATQSPIIARTMKSEREARASFYGMMILEGIIAMVWAGAALAIYNNYLPELGAEYWAKSPNGVLPDITTLFLGSKFGTITVIAVVVLAVTSGDTAMRCMRLSLAEMMKVDQKAIGNRFALCLPLALIVVLLLVWSNQDKESFGKLWNYFAWGNQVIAIFTLGAGSVWLFAKRRNGWIASVPCLYMTFIVVMFILWTSPEHKGPQGFGLPMSAAGIIALICAVVYTAWCILRGRKFARVGRPEAWKEFDVENDEAVESISETASQLEK